MSLHITLLEASPGVVGTALVAVHILVLTADRAFCFLDRSPVAIVTADILAHMAGESPAVVVCMVGWPLISSG